MTRCTTFYSLGAARHVASFQRFCGLHSVDNKIVVRSKLAFWVFTLGAKLGYELFYTLSFSFCFWHLDSWLCRRLMLVWAILMYIGQAVKEIVKIPRPTGEGVIVLEPEYTLEYGLPSTHAVLALSMPIALGFNLTGRYEFSIVPFVIIATLWCSVICLSRLYLGMHTILDLITGLALTCLLIGPILQHLDTVDQYLIHSQWTPIYLLTIIIIAGYFYPTPRFGSPSRGDTCTIISGAAGVYLGAWTLYQQYILLDLNDSLKVPTNNSYLIVLTRSVLGLAVMALSRLFGKSIGRTLIHTLYNIDPDQEENRYKRSVEVPIKLITYTIVGFSLAYVIALFNFLHIGRQTVYYEA